MRQHSLVVRMGWASAWLLIGCIPWLAGPANALTVRLAPSRPSLFTDRAQEGPDPPTAISEVAPTGLPEAATTPGAVEEGSSAFTHYDLSQDALEIGFTHGVGGPVGYAFSQSISVVYFYVDEDVGYRITGSFETVDSDGRGVFLLARLSDVTGTPVVVFESEQRSDATPDESFVLGGSGGDLSNTSTGSATGTLLAFHVYALYANVGLENYPILPRTSGATATGGVTLLIPEPAAGLLVSMGAVGLARRRR